MYKGKRVQHWLAGAEIRWWSRGLSHSAAIKGPEKSTTNCSPRGPSGRKRASEGRGPPHARVLNLLRIGPDSQSYGFPVVMYRRESGTIKKDERQRIDAFELWCWRRLLRVPQTVRRSNQSILKEINPEYSLNRLILKLKLQYFGHPVQRVDSLEKPWCWERLKAGEKGWRQEEKKDAEDEIVGWHRWLKGQEFEQTPEDSEGQGNLACCGPWDGKELDTTWRLNKSNLWFIVQYVIPCNISFLLRANVK